MNEKHLFSNTDIRKLLLPIMVEQLLASLMGMVDTIMVSNVGSAAISAVSLVDSINILVIQAVLCPRGRRRDPVFPVYGRKKYPSG